MATLIHCPSSSLTRDTIPIIPEIRHLIYYRCFHDCVLTFRKPSQPETNDPYILQPSLSSRSVLALLGVSRQTRAEAIPVLCKEVLFDVQDNITLSAFFDRVDKPFRQQIEKVSFSVAHCLIWAQPLFLSRWAGLKTLIFVPDESPLAVLEGYGEDGDESQKALCAQVKDLFSFGSSPVTDEGQKMAQLREKNLSAWVKKRWAMANISPTQRENLDAVLAVRKATGREFEVFGTVIVDWTTDALINLTEKDQPVTYISGITRKRDTVRQVEHHKRVEIAENKRRAEEDARRVASCDYPPFYWYPGVVTRSMTAAFTQMEKKRILGIDQDD